MSCGCVCEEHHIDMGQAKRSFEDKPDQGHHGPSPNPLMPDSWNTRTSLSKLKQGGPGSVAVVDPGDAPSYPSPPLSMLISTPTLLPWSCLMPLSFHPLLVPSLPPSHQSSSAWLPFMTW